MHFSMLPASFCRPNSIRRMESTLARDLMQSSKGSHARDMLGELTHMQETRSRDLQL